MVLATPSIANTLPRPGRRLAGADFLAADQGFVATVAHISDFGFKLRQFLVLYWEHALSGCGHGKERKEKGRLACQAAFLSHKSSAYLMMAFSSPFL
jgi:hypothetical protein